MSIGIGASGSRTESQRSNFFRDLPEEMLQAVLSYITPREGVCLMCTQKALNRRLIGVLLTNQRGYFTSLCNKLSRHFLFAPEGYRQDAAKKEEEIKKGWQWTMYEDVPPQALRWLDAISDAVGREICCLGSTQIETYDLQMKNFGLFSNRKLQGASFFCSFQENVPLALEKIGKELIRLNVANPRELIELTEMGEGEEEAREVCIKIALSLNGKIEGERAFHLINAISKEREKERAMHVWTEGVDRKDPFLETEEFLAWISPVPLIKCLVRTGAGGHRVLELFDKTMEHPDLSVTKEVLFRFFHYWCEHGPAFEEPLRNRLYGRFMALIERLPEEERNGGILHVLQGMISRRRFFDYQGNFSNYPLSSWFYLRDQVERKKLSPVKMMETLSQIIKQVAEHKSFSDGFGISTPYSNEEVCREMVLNFFPNALRYVRREGEAGQLLRIAQEIGSSRMDELDELARQMLALRLR